MDEKIKKARNFRNYKLWQDAEGAAKPSDVEFAHFLNTAFGSAFEVETQLLIAKNVGYINDNHNLNVNDNLNDKGTGVKYEELLTECQEI